MSDGYPWWPGGPGAGPEGWMRSSGTQDLNTTVPTDEVRRVVGRGLSGLAEEPVAFVPAADVASARTFPFREVAKLDVDGGSAVARRVVHTVLFLMLTFALAWVTKFDDSPRFDALGLPDSTWFITAVVIVLAFLLVIVVAVDFGTVVTWEMYALCAVLGFVFLILVRESFAAIVCVPAVLGVLGLAVRRSRTARRLGWRRLAPIVDDHRLVEAEVVRLGKSISYGRGPDTLSVLVVLASAQVPGREWRVLLQLVGFRDSPPPKLGDRMLLFVCPGDLDVAVVRHIDPKRARA